MRNRDAFVALPLVVLAFAGCGSSNKAATTAAAGSAATTAPTRSTATATTGAVPANSKVYTVHLSGATGTPAGARNGSGLAVISISASSRKLCWQFSQLKKVTSPLVAVIHRGLGGKSSAPGITLGGFYKPAGCAPQTASVLGQLLASPQMYYVVIENVEYPHGAMRGQL